jgi:hypothetical protein
MERATSPVASCLGDGYFFSPSRSLSCGPLYAAEATLPKALSQLGPLAVRTPPCGRRYHRESVGTVGCGWGLGGMGREAERLDANPQSPLLLGLNFVHMRLGMSMWCVNKDHADTLLNMIYSYPQLSSPNYQPPNTYAQPPDIVVRLPTTARTSKWINSRTPNCLSSITQNPDRDVEGSYRPTDRDYARAFLITASPLHFVDSRKSCL